MSPNLRQDAIRGDPYACLALAYFYQTGKEMPQSIPSAMEWFERASERSCSRAHWELAKMFLEGEYVEQDIDLYLSHLVSAAELGNPEAQVRLGYEYGRGALLPRDDVVSYGWLMKAAVQGNPMAKFAVGYMLQHGRGVEKSKAEAESWFSSAAISGDGEMFLLVGLNYEFGMGRMERDLVEAARWYKYGVDMGHEKCVLCWRSVLETLDGQPQESYEMRQAKLMNTASQAELDKINTAMIAADSLFEEGDERGAMDYYQMAADLGSPEAMFAVAMMHHQGLAVRRDDALALRLLSRAADAGSADAQFYLATAYENGVIPSDDSQIVKLYSDAAHNGFLAAFYYLGKYVEHLELYVRRTHSRR